MYVPKFGVFSLRPKFVVSLFFFLCVQLLSAQGSVCADSVGDNGADPFCSSTGIVFPNCNSSNSDCTNSSESGPNYGCLTTQPFPAWYYLQIDEGGQLRFNIVQTANEDGTGAQLDVDFICYGPFTDPVSPCTSELTAGNTIDCSYSPSFNEFMTIPNAIAGEFYLVLITNFSQQAGYISFQQESGAGSTDCSILDATLGPNQDICGSGSVDLDGTTEEAIRYEWSVFNETTMVFDVIAGETNPIYTVVASGRYRLLVEDAAGNTETDEIVITFNTIPAIENAPQDITLCELSSDSAEFDFTNNTSLILGTQDPAQFTITYYLSQSEADNATNPIPDVFTTVASQIFARIENNDLTTCFTTTSFELIIDPAPNLSETNYNYSICEAIDATPNQGTLSFVDMLLDLTNNSGQLVNLLATDEPLNIGDFIVTYHNSEAEAISGANPIPDMGLVTDGTVLFVRVQNNQSSNPTGCFNVDNIAQITISVNQIPEVNSNVPDLTECATSIADQNVAVFDLTLNDINISVVNNPPGVQVVYYASQQDFDQNNPIPDSDETAFQNSSNPQTIISVVIDPMTRCEMSTPTSFDLIVEPLPVLADSEAFSGVRAVCVFPDGTVQNPTTLGEDLGAVDGQIYIYDWTPDNADLDNDGNEDPVYVVNQLTGEQVFNLTITRINSSGLGVDCSNSTNPETLEPYSITLRPTAAPTQVGYEVAEPSFSGTYTITAIPDLVYGEASDIEYTLNNGTFQDSPIFENVPPGDHVITARNRFGCQPEVQSEVIMLLDYPKYFTPNGDGFHDTWSLINIEDQPTALIYIFDRYGKLLKQITAGGPGWDGTYNGNPMPSADYWFRVEFNEPTDPQMTRRVFTANFSLIR
ncbi:T9SS type B sorting domain-containing protein [Aquimarina sp. 2201CG5-10]|uniref:T9SS type B sorting domain-containing protein n=1 Tax=Aquimarina callyspongiae TaxID=3098150 RepID=UPI002AB47D84|nr:T9SS type B sorting domain-containing protein [Aquimarina sp. 2201CG5-10]MDY8134261.1 T9SS type B sorting domain-containing protein [Aquimarina sp. 2201CG5-10]